MTRSSQPIAHNSESADETRIALPWPVSTNALFIQVGNKRVRTKEYRDWAREAGWTLQAQRPRKFTGPVTIRIELCPPHSRRFDLDNRTKSTLDLLTEHQVIRDDHDGFVRSVTVERVQNAAPCVVTIKAVP